MFNSTTNRGYSMNKLRNRSLALTLALLASVSGTARAGHWMFGCAPCAPVACPTLTQQLATFASGNWAYGAGLAAAYPAWKAAKYLDKKAGVSRRTKAAATSAASWVKNKVNPAPAKPGYVARMCSVAQPFGDKAQYTADRYQPAEKGKWFFTRKDKEGNRFATDWFFRTKKGGYWSGKNWATRSSSKATKERVNNLRARFGKGKFGDAVVGTSNFANKHPWVSNAVYYPLLATAVYYGYKGAVKAYEKAFGTNLNAICDAVLEKVQTMIEANGKAEETTLFEAVQKDEELQKQINRLPLAQQHALNAAIAQFDNAFGLEDAQMRKEALSNAVDAISAVFN